MVKNIKNKYQDNSVINPLVQDYFIPILKIESSYTERANKYNAKQKEESLIFYGYIHRIKTKYELNDLDLHYEYFYMANTLDQLYNSMSKGIDTFKKYLSFTDYMAIKNLLGELINRLKILTEEDQQEQEQEEYN